jgi:nucleotide-binding universal stress UspA family protein
VETRKIRYKSYLSAIPNSSRKKKLSEKNLLKIKKILVAIDKSGYKDKAVSYAFTLAKSLGAEINIIHVIDQSSMVAVGSAHPSASMMAQREYQDALEQDADKLLKEIVQLGKKEGITVHDEVLAGTSVKQTILDYAKDKNVDLILVGTKGMTGIKKFLMGSVANDVISHAHCAVLAVR